MSDTKDIPLITVTELQEKEDGSATCTIDTSPEATRFLIEMGLLSLLEKAVDADNDEYSVA